MDQEIEITIKITKYDLIQVLQTTEKSTDKKTDNIIFEGMKKMIINKIAQQTKEDFTSTIENNFILPVLKDMLFYLTFTGEVSYTIRKIKLDEKEA